MTAQPKNKPKRKHRNNKAANINPNTGNMTPNTEYSKEQYAKKEKASHSWININCPHRELASLPLCVLIFFGVLGLCAFLFCAYIWLWGLPTKIIKANQVSTDESVIVGILALLITLLVTWNIWQTIISREEVRKIDAVRKRLGKLEVNIEAQRGIFRKHNLEIICLIDAHAKLYEAEQGGDLSDKYINYAEAIRLLLQSNVDLSYEQFDRAQYGLISVINQFVLNTNPLEVEDFISREKEYNRYYALFISLLNKRGSEIEEFKERLTQLHDHRKATIKQVKESDMGQRIEQNRKKFIELEKQLREKDARRKADGKNPNGV